MDWNWLIWVGVAYLAGSIPFALLIGLGRGTDLRTVGSGNLGATNVGRVLGLKWGVLCFVLDVLKGLLPVVGAGVALGYWGKEPLPSVEAWKWLAVAAAAVVGHMFPVWLGFKGGKGAATSLGVLLAFWPTLTLPGIAAFVTWLALVRATRYVSLASITAAVALPVYLVIVALLRGVELASVVPFLVVAALLALLVVVRHRSNITRLLAGTENKLRSKTGEKEMRRD